MLGEILCPTRHLRSHRAPAHGSPRRCDPWPRCSSRAGVPCHPISSITPPDAAGSKTQVNCHAHSQYDSGRPSAGRPEQEERCVSLLFQQSDQRLTSLRPQLAGVDRAVVVGIGGLETLLNEGEIFGLIERAILVGIRCGHGLCV